jgi:hypothetical protein
VIVSSAATGTKASSQLTTSRRDLD